MGKLKVKSKVSVDKLSYVGYKTEQFQILINSLTERLIEKRTVARYPYEWNYHLFGGAIIQERTAVDKTDVRIEFNPNSLKGAKGAYYVGIMKFMSTFKYVRATRVDIAIDLYNIDMNDYVIMDTKGRKTVEYRGGSGELETFYVGAPASDLRIRIYDKRKEQGQSENSPTWWRVEAQVSGELIDHLDKFSPFEGLELIRKDRSLDHIKSFKEQVFIRHLLNNPKDLERLSRTTRYRYKKILSDLGRSESKRISFCDIYKKNYNTVLDTIEEFKQPSEVNNRIIL